MRMRNRMIAVRTVTMMMMRSGLSALRHRNRRGLEPCRDIARPSRGVEQPGVEKTGSVNRAVAGAQNHGGRIDRADAVHQRCNIPGIGKIGFGHQNTIGDGQPFISIGG